MLFRSWEDFRRKAVTETVREIGEAVRAVRPEALVSAAVFPTAQARRRVYQDAEGWVRDGRVDCVFPMIYEDDDAAFREAVAEGEVLFRRGGRTVSIPGIGAYRHRTAEQTLRQMRMCRQGFAVFSYSSFYVSPDETRRENERLCRERREAVRRFLAPAR